MSGVSGAGRIESAWSALLRRKLVQWSLAYSAAAWALLQGVGFVADAFGWPAAVKQVATIVLLLGLPLVLVIAWYHGERGEQRVGGTELAILVSIIALGGVLLWRFEPAATTAEVESLPSRTLPATGAGPSVAVLPFENRSHEPDDAYFVDGIQDDILSRLARIGALKVISRTSVERFRDTTLPIREIASQLGVTTVLEGGVQRAGNRVRINVQLIDARSDTHVWSESYDRELTGASVFDVQGEIATAVADALEATLTPDEKRRVKAVPTDNLPAWEAYQAGRTRMATRTSDGLADAQKSFELAIALDPGFALGYVGLADVLFLQADYRTVPAQAAKSRAEEMLGAALAIDPDLPEALTTAAKFAQNRGDLKVAEAGFRRAIRLNPNYSTAYQWYGVLLAATDRDAEALGMARKSVELDPMSPVLRLVLGTFLVGVGRFEEGLAQFERMLAIDPSLPGPYAGIGWKTARVDGRLGDAIPWFDKAAELDPSVPEWPAVVAQLYVDLNDATNAKHWVERAEATGPGAGDEVRAMLDLYRGDHDETVALAYRAYKQDPMGVSNWPRRLIRDDDLRARRFGPARNRYEEIFPELFEADTPKVVARNYEAAIDLALLLQRAGDHELADRLLMGSEAAIRKYPRMGQWGYGLADVQVYALRGETPLALQSLNDAVKAGWRGPYWRYYRDHDPSLASLRSHPEFAAAFHVIERDVDAQRAELAKRPSDAPPSLTSSAG